MIDLIKLDEKSYTPKYLQIINAIIYNISIGTIQTGDKIPSINKLSQHIFSSRDTVERAYSILKKQKIVVSVHGKGTYIAKNPAQSKQNVLFLVNKLSTFKMMVFNSFVKKMGALYQVDLHSYHCDESLFLELLEKHKTNYDLFVILPHFRTKNLLHQNITDKVTIAINKLPKDRLVLLDNKEHQIKGNFIEVYQDFKADIINALNVEIEKISNYNSLILVYPKSTFYPYPKEIADGFKEFCVQNNFKFQIIEEISNNTEITNKDLYITLNEDDLVNLVRKSRKNNYVIGKDIGIISYNDTPLKQLLGISVLSSDLNAMGEQAAKMLKEAKTAKIKSPFNFIIRESL